VPVFVRVPRHVRIGVADLHRPEVNTNATKVHPAWQISKAMTAWESVRPETTPTWLPAAPTRA
jgi:hypothetical protein